MGAYHARILSWLVLISIPTFRRKRATSRLPLLSGLRVHTFAAFPLRSYATFLPLLGVLRSCSTSAIWWRMREHIPACLRPCTFEMASKSVCSARPCFHVRLFAARCRDHWTCCQLQLWPRWRGLCAQLR